MLFSAIFVSLIVLCFIFPLTPAQIIHLIFAWSSFLSWTLLIIDFLLMGFLGMHAYRDGKSSILQVRSV